MRVPGKKEWAFGYVIGDVDNRSHVVAVNYKHYRRNCRWLRATPEETSEPTELTEQTEFPTELPHPLVPSTRTVPEPPSRLTREHRSPLWLKDYECSGTRHFDFASCLFIYAVMFTYLMHCDFVLYTRTLRYIKIFYTLCLLKIRKGDVTSVLT